MANKKTKNEEKALILLKIREIIDSLYELEEALGKEFKLKGIDGPAVIDV